MIRAFLFDYGGVMTASEKGGQLGERLGKLLDMPAAQAYQLLAQAWDNYVVGDINEDDVWKRIEASSGKTIPEDQRTIWNTWQQSSMLPEMKELIQSLKAKGYPVGLVSNVIPNTMEEISQHGGYEDFDFTILSCEVGYAKPDPEIYKLAFDYLPGIQPEEIVFVDDQERFLGPAKELGMQTVLATSSDQVISAIQAMTVS